MMSAENGVAFDLIHVSPVSNDSYTNRSVDVTSRTGNALSVRIDPPQNRSGSTPLFTSLQLVAPFSDRRRWKPNGPEYRPSIAHRCDGAYWSTHTPSASPSARSL